MRTNILELVQLLCIIAISVVPTYVGMTFGYKAGAAALLLCVVISLLFCMVVPDGTNAQTFNIPGSQKSKSRYFDDDEIDEINEIEDADEDEIEDDDDDEPDEDEIEDVPALKSTSSSLPAYVSDALASLHLGTSMNLTRAVVMDAWRKQVRKVHSDKNSNAKTDDFESIMAARDTVLKFLNKE